MFAIKKNFLIFLFFIITCHSSYSNQSFEKEIAIIENFLSKKIPGIDTSYRSFFDILIQENIPVYLHGGPIRDLLSEPTIEPKDVDFTFNCTRETLIKVLDHYDYPYIALPDSKVVLIGKVEGHFLEGYSISLENRNNIYHQEFTVNSVLYNLKTKEFSQEFQEKINDIKNKRLRIETSEWDRWITEDYTLTPHYKIFRFFKMVGKGYCYEINLEKYMKRKIVKLSKNNEEFSFYFLKYLGRHYSSLNEIEHGAKCVMGEQWTNKFIQKNKDKIKKIAIEFENNLKTSTKNYSSY